MASALIGGAALGAPFSEVLSLIIKEAKNVKSFDKLLVDLVERMDRVLDYFKEIHQLQEGTNPSMTQLYKLMERTNELLPKCAKLKSYQFWKKGYYARKIQEINEDFITFCSTELQLYLHENMKKHLENSLLQEEKTEEQTKSNFKLTKKRVYHHGSSSDVYETPPQSMSNATASSRRSEIELVSSSGKMILRLWYSCSSKSHIRREEQSMSVSKPDQLSREYLRSSGSSNNSPTQVKRQLFQEQRKPDQLSREYLRSSGSSNNSPTQLKRQLFREQCKPEQLSREYLRSSGIPNNSPTQVKRQLFREQCKPEQLSREYLRSSGISNNSPTQVKRQLFRETRGPKHHLKRS